MRDMQQTNVRRRAQFQRYLQCMFRKIKLMNRYEQERANDLKRIAVALEKLTKLLTQLMKDNA